MLKEISNIARMAVFLILSYNYLPWELGENCMEQRLPADEDRKYKK